MTPKTWKENAPTLFNAQNLTDEFSAIGLLINRVGADLDDFIARKINLADGWLFRDLTIAITEVYASNATMYGIPYTFNQWYAYAGYTWDRLDEVLDLIMNPEVLVPTANMYLLRACVLDAEFASFASYGDSSKKFDKMNEWIDGDGTAEHPGELKRRFRQVTRELLKIDLDKNGIVDLTDRVATKRTLWRV